jgi:dipeptidyl aminopeptidase/acylaminoacyl peptidase
MEEEMIAKRLMSFALILLLPLVGGADEKKVLQPEDHMKEVRVGAPEVSPDGKWIAFSLSRYLEDKKERVSDIYLMPFGGGEPKRLTATPGGESGYTWSPCSMKIAFSARREGDKSQIYVIDIRGGEAERITEVKTGASGPLWSPDGKWIAFYSDLGDLYTEEEKAAFGDVRYCQHLRYYHLGPGWDTGARQRVFVVPSAGGEAKQLTDGECADEGDHSMAWSMDSKKIAYVSNRSEEWWNTIDTNIYYVDVETGKSEQVTTNVGPDHSPAFSPDGKRLAWRASYEYNYESENYKVHVVPVGGGEIKALTTTLDHNVRSIAWGVNSDRVYFTASNEGASNIQWVEIDKPEVFADLTKGQNLINRFVAVDDSRFVLLNSSDVESSEIYTLVNGSINKLTDYGSEFWGQYNVMPCEEVWIDTEDGRKAEGWLIKPVGYEEGKRYPTILAIHGGPHGMYTPSLRFENQLFANHGFAVLFTNPRGSDGYGQEFQDVIVEDWGRPTWSDLERFVDKAIEMGVADPDRLGVTGGSFGGYATMWIVGQTDRFKAAVPVAGLSNLVSFFGTTDEQFFMEKEMGGVPWANKDVYMSNSSICYAGNYKTPTMVIHGNDDWRVRVEQAEQFFTALQKMGVPSVFANFPDEQHGVRGTKHLTLYYQLKMEWFGHWLQGKPVKLAKYIAPRAYVHPPRPAESK